MTGTDVQVLNRGSMDPFQVMDSLDEEQMLAELQGAVAKTLVYEFRLDGKMVTGLSKIGVDECCIALAAQGQVIREEDVTFQLRGEGEQEEALFKATAARFAVGAGEVLLDRVIGVKRQPLYEFRGGKLKANPHWYETGAMKAVRNARFRLIPSKTREAVIAMAKAAGSVRQVEEHPSGKGALPQPDPEEVEAQAHKELLEILPSLAANQQEWVKGKLGDGASVIDLLDFAREKMPRPKGGGSGGTSPTPKSNGSTTTTTPGASAAASSPETTMPTEQNPAGGDNE